MQKITWHWGFALALLCGGFGWQSGHAHRPRLPDSNWTPANAWHIGNAEISWAMYAELPVSTAVAYYTFDVPVTMEVAPELLVEDEIHSEGFSPLYVMYGALQALTDVATAPVVVPAGNSWLVSNSIDEHFFEAFTRKSFRRTARITQTLQPGTYGIAVFEPAGRTGSYVLGIGKGETFDGSDFPPMFAGCGRVFY